MQIELPWSPTVNTYWRTARGRTYISAKGKAYREEVIARVQALDLPKPLEGRLTVHIWAYPPDKRRRDLDNLLKALLDALEHAGMYLDDNQIDDLRIERRPMSPPDGRIVVHIGKRA
jgi:crossover junction endodeoxyribonuclease RusA